MPGALDGLRVLEVGELVSAPYATKLLADLGADVVKIEPPGVGDRARRRGPFPGGTPHPEKSGLFLYLNTNKRGITLDLSTAAGRAALERLVAEKGATDPVSLARYRDAWDRAAERTPHGQPIELRPEDFG